MLMQFWVINLVLTIIINEMKEKDNNTHQPNQSAIKNVKNNFSGYPAYPSIEDIYTRYYQEKDINPEDTSKIKVSNEDKGTRNEKDFNDDVSGSDLDIPGSELDDKQENIGSEDEENNYYSLGGDDHNDLDEDKGE
jgi:hypothetical protein